MCVCIRKIAREAGGPLRRWRFGALVVCHAERRHVKAIPRKHTASITDAKVENARCENSDASIPPWQLNPIPIPLVVSMLLIFESICPPWYHWLVTHWFANTHSRASRSVSRVAPSCAFGLFGSQGGTAGEQCLHACSVCTNTCPLAIKPTTVCY